jgi:hypothetical protein
MLSKIGEFIKPTPSKGDTVEKPGDQPGREKKDRKKDDTSPEENHDDTYFSIDAVLALLKQENVTLDADVTASLDWLRQQGITNIPIRNNQPILEAIIEAAALKNK